MRAHDGVALTIAAFFPRARQRGWARRLATRRGTRIVATRSPDEFAGLFHTSLVDAALVDMGAGDGTSRVAALALEYPSVAFFGVTSLRPSDTPSVAQCAECEFANVLVDSVDEPVVRDLVGRCAYSTRFADALRTPPESLALHTPLRLSAWHYLTARAGRPVQTSALAGDLGLTREHLSRSFGTEGAPTLKRLIDLVRVMSAAELAKNPGYDVADIARILEFSSAAHLSLTTMRVMGRRATSLAAMRGVDVVERFAREQRAAPVVGRGRAAARDG